ncbi:MULTISPECIES: hypothetical protein [unclassified Leisingera]|uniref:hypothetical protein n=1 Tax=unclassified Leisingera TaxID=2614906 RepID=UPI0010109812|nr:MULTISPECIES: hypothetical protein [unclassified Leisingera]MBQ4823089.1 hypothetical protein [Leisingera sp. HS039]MCF6429410.1 hypothetical protein [Leisingera sp. MMG026]QAX29576.1 hypothetical protein ETW24_09495 [Leisingera sp. NJS204]QBR36319.1 hypothetical protein ETW23_09360 [Leisingera sp. NJS201]
MGTIETLAQKLALDTIKVQEASGEDRLYVEVGQVLGAASQSLEEAFLTEMRVRLAERKAREFLNQKVSAIQAQLDAKGEA